MNLLDLYSKDACPVCGQTPCNCTHINEEKVRLDPRCWKGKKIGNPKTKIKGGVRVNNCVPAESVAEDVATPGHRLIELFNLIYRNGGDDAVDYLLYNSPIFADYYDQYEGDLESIAAEVNPKELQVMVDELEEVAENEGLAEDAVADFVARGGKIQHGKTHPPRKAERWQGSAHIGAAGGKGSKGTVSGLGANTNPKGGKPVVTAEGSEFGGIYAEQLAQQTFDIKPDLKDENEVLNLGYSIAVRELGPRARGFFRDEDFPSDFVSAYGWLQDQRQQGVAEMDKSQPSHGRDGRISHSTYGSRDRGGSTGPEHTAQATTADKMMKDAHDAMMKSMTAADKVKKGWRNPNINEVSDKTLIDYLKAVEADALKHSADPSKRSPEKASRSVQGFSRAFNKLDARKEPVNEISPEGPDSDEDYREWERLKDVHKKPYNPDWDNDDEEFMQKWYRERGLEEQSGLGFGEADEKEADYGKSYQDMVKRMGAKSREQEQSRPVDVQDLARRLRAIEQSKDDK